MSIINNIGVVGAGMMGSEIALCFAMAGHDVALKDVSVEQAQKGKDAAEKRLKRSLEKGNTFNEEIDTILQRIYPTENYNDFSKTDLIIEAVFEDREIKTDVFRELDRICKPDCILATNTSSLPITLLSTAVNTERIGNFIGTHFFSPASVMKLVEVIPGLETRSETTDTVIALLQSIGKEAVKVRDVAGFAVNRVFHAMLIEACRLLEEDVASPEDIDRACRFGLGHPMGPFELMDVLNNRLNLDVQEILHTAYGERFMPRPNLKLKVFANHLGRVSGKGWYSYEKK